MGATLDDEERKLRMDQMRADIKLKEAQEMKAKQDWRLDPVRVVISAFVAGGALVGGIVALVNYLHPAMH